MTDHVGITRDQWHRYYFNGDGPLPSVTTILRLGDAITGTDGLMYYHARKALEAAVDVAPQMAAVLEASHPEEGKRLAYDLAWPGVKRAVNAAADLGTAVHKQVELVLSGQGSIPDPVTDPYLARFADFLAVYREARAITEGMVVNLSARYAGTFDIITPVEGRLSLVDVKTGEDKPKYVYQLAGYLAAEGMAFEGNPDLLPMPEIQACYVLILHADRYQLVERTPTPADIEHFLFMADAYNRLKAGPRTEAEEEVAA